MALSVSLAEPALFVDPGGFVRTEVLVRNTGAEPESMQVRVTGAAAAWSWVVPPEVDIPAAGEAVVSLGFRVRRTPDPASGELAFDVVVARAGRAVAGTASGTLSVAPFRHLYVELDPPGAAPTPTEHYLVVENRGNVPVTTTLRPSGDGDNVEVVLGSEVVDTPPGARVVVSVTVRPGKGRAMRGRSLPFAVTAEAAGDACR